MNENWYYDLLTIENVSQTCFRLSPTAYLVENQLKWHFRLLRMIGILVIVPKQMVTDVIDINFTFLKIVFGYILLIFSDVLWLLMKKNLFKGKNIHIQCKINDIKSPVPHIKI